MTTPVGQVAVATRSARCVELCVGVRASRHRDVRGGPLVRCLHRGCQGGGRGRARADHGPQPRARGRTPAPAAHPLVSQHLVLGGRLPTFRPFPRAFFPRHPDLAANVHMAATPGVAGRRMLSIVNEETLRRILSRMLDESEFFSPHGIRALSRAPVRLPARGAGARRASHSPLLAKREGAACGLRRHREAPERPSMARSHPVLRVLPR
jgi:hypothetical protein